MNGRGGIKFVWLWKVETPVYYAGNRFHLFENQEAATAFVDMVNKGVDRDSVPLEEAKRMACLCGMAQYFGGPKSW